MRIDNIHIHAFGKFSDLNLKLNEGINILMGDNEAGKSTIHQFIEAMFFGFFKPYTKKKLYEDTYDKYIPWDHSGYGGSLTFTDNHQTIRLERHFFKGKDKLQIFDAKTGEDITETYDYDKVTKMANVAIKHLGFNKVTYRNTVSLTQMQQRTEEDMVREIKDNMSNLASTHQSSISVEKVLEAVAVKENKIGSLRKPTSPYKKLTKHILALEEELLEAQSIHQKIAVLKEEENQLLQDHEKATMEENKIRGFITYVNRMEDKAIYNKAFELEQKIKELEDKLSSLAMYKDFSVTVVNQLQKDREVIQKMVLDGEKMYERKQHLAETLKSYEYVSVEETDSDKLGQNYENLKQVIHSYEEDEKALALREQEVFNYNQQLSMLGDTLAPNKSFLATILLAVLGVAGIVAGFLYSVIMFGFVLIIAIAYMGLHYFDQQKSKEYKQNLEKQSKYHQQLERAEKAILEINGRLSKKLDNVGAKDLYHLKQMRDDALKALSKMESKLEENKQKEGKKLQLKQEMEGLLRTIESIENRKKVLEEDYQNTLNHYHIAHPEAIQSALEKYHQYMSVNKEKLASEERLKELLSGRTLIALKQQLNNLEKVTLPEGTTKESLDGGLEAINKDIVTIREQLSEVMTRGNELSKSCRHTAEIEEELEQARILLQSYDKKLQVASVIKEAVSTIAEEIQNNFAPVLNDALSTAVAQISQNKYKDIKVNPQMMVTVFDEESHRTVKADSLSEGTIDMLYFGLRLGVGDVLSEGRRLPLILDDAFVQYDDKRLQGALDLLMKQNRQVLLFTCHEREKNYFEQNNMPYQLIGI